MKVDKKPVIGLICVVLSSILVMGITLGLLSSANNTATAGSKVDTTDNSTGTPKVSPENEMVYELEWGYKHELFGSTGREMRWPIYMGYKAIKKTFDIDSVNLILSFGVMSYNEIDTEFIEIAREYGGWDISEFEIYFADEYGNNIMARKVAENFISEKYRVTFVTDELNNICYFVFNHSEEITIPKELFTENEGIIKICIGGMNVAGDEPGYEVLCNEHIKYQLVENDKVILSLAWE